MNRNVESHFSELPKVDISRSIFDRSSSHKTSFNVGDLIPFYLDEVLPGDTFKITTSCVVRLQTPLTPIMDNIYLDTYYFFIPYRLVWTHWKEFMGENTASAWIPSTTYSIPKTTMPSSGWNVGTIADYMGIPTGITAALPGSVSNLPFRCYALCADTWFRDQNLTNPVLLNLGDSTTTGNNGTNYVTDLQAGGYPFKVAKYHDYFTSCLPAPQKHADIKLLTNYANGTTVGINPSNVYAPVITRSSDIPTLSTAAMHMNNKNSSAVGYLGYTPPYDSSGEDVFLADAPNNFAIPSNLWADLSAANLSINDLRIAFQLQKYYEKNARAGTRYREILKEHFGVTSSDARMQIPEYLGGHRFPLSIHQVTNQTSGSTEFLGDLGAMSNTSDVHEDFVKSFEEHGICLGLCCVRYDHSYPQGLEKMWKRFDREQFYFPVMANIGEMPVWKSEIYWNGLDSDSVFGYQEAWAEYRSDGLGRYKIAEKNWKAA